MADSGTVLQALGESAPRLEAHRPLIEMAGYVNARAQKQNIV